MAISINDYKNSLEIFCSFGKLRQCLIRPGLEGLRTNEFNIVNKDFEFLCISSGLFSLFTSFYLTKKLFKVLNMKKIKLMNKFFILSSFIIFNILQMQILAANIERKMHKGILYILNQSIYHEWISKKIIYSIDFDLKENKFDYISIIKN